MGPEVYSGSSSNKLKGILHSILRKNSGLEPQTALASDGIINNGSHQSAISRPAAEANQNSPTATSAVRAKASNLAKAISDVGATSLHLTEAASTTGIPFVYSNARDNVLSDPGMLIQPVAQDSTATAAQVTKADIAAAAASLPVGQRSSNGSIKEPGASVWLHEAAIGSMSCSAASSPMPSQHHIATVDMGLGRFCQSIDDMYSVIFGDCQNNATGTSASGSRRASTTSLVSSSNLHLEHFEPHIYESDDIQQASAGYQHYCRMQHTTDHLTTAVSGSPVIGPLDDLIVPAGLAPIRTGGWNRQSCGSGAGLPARTRSFDGKDGREVAGDQASNWNHATVQAGWTEGSLPKGIPRYSFPCSTSEDGQLLKAKQQQQHDTDSNHNHKKRLWDRRREAALSNEASSGYSSSAPSSPSAGSKAAGSTSAPGGIWRTSTSPLVTASAGCASRSLGRKRSCSPAVDCDTTCGNRSDSATPLAHSYSYPDMMPAGSNEVPPACARALFGGSSQTDKPLMSVGSGSWLTRADSCMDDHLSVASDDGYIREVNAENVLSSVWGPTNRTSKLLSFKYSVATSPLNHPGRASPFMNSPFQSPRGSYRESLADLLPLRSASATVQSCPGSPLARNSSSLVNDAATVPRQGHRHLLRQCLTDAAAGAYRPSPLQRDKTHNSAHSTEGDVAGGERCTFSSCSSQMHGLRSSAVTGAVCDVLGNATGHVNRGNSAVLGQDVICDPVQETTPEQISNAPGISRQTGSSRAGSRSGGPPAAAVDALMLGWTDSQSDSRTYSSGAASPNNIGQLLHVQRDRSSSCSSVYSATNALVSGLGLCSGSLIGSDTNNCVSPSSGQQTGMCFAETSASRHCLPMNAAGTSAETPCGSQAPSGLSVCRSKSMPTPGLLHSGTGSVLGVENLVPGHMKADGRSPGSSPPPRPRLQTSASADHSQQQQKLLGESSAHVQRDCRRNSGRVSNSHITNPSRLSQSSAADEVPSMFGVSAAGRSRSSTIQSDSLSQGLSSTVGDDLCDVVHASRVHSEPGVRSAATASVEEVELSVRRKSFNALTVRCHQQQQAPEHQCSTPTSVVGCGGFKSTPDNSSGSTVGQTNSSSMFAAEQHGMAPSPAECQVQLALPSLPEVDFIERIGRGSFGEVYKGVWCGSVVAVKVIRVKQHRASMNRGPAAGPISSCDARRLGIPSSSDCTAPLSCNSSSGASSVSAEQHSHQQQLPVEEPDAQEQQIALELAQHEYESWINANLRHPNIVQLFTSFTVVLEDRPAALLPAFSGSSEGFMSGSGVSWNTHLVMEYCELGTMQGVLQRGLFMDPTCASRCNALAVLMTAKEFCTAVAYLHSMDVVHGDLKSSNVLLKAAATTPLDGRGFTAKVSDFGLSRVMDAISAANGAAAITAAASSCGDDISDASGGGSGAPIGQWPMQAHFGALSHAAPELIKGEKLSKASDVYSVGVLLWELVTGKAPFYGIHPGQVISMKLCHPTSELLHFSDTAPAALAALASDCWADCPAQRPLMSAVVDRLNSFALDLLGEEQAVMLFPDIARLLNARRRTAAP